MSFEAIGVGKSLTADVANVRLHVSVYSTKKNKCTGVSKWGSHKSNECVKWIGLKTK